MMAMIANISALALAAINLATPLLCKLPKLENFTLLAYKSSMSSMLALLAFYLAALIATAKSQKAANSLAKIVKIGVLVKVVSTIVPQAASLEVLLNRKPHSNVRKRERGGVNQGWTPRPAPRKAGLAPPRPAPQN